MGEKETQANQVEESDAGKEESCHEIIMQFVNAVNTTLGMKVYIIQKLVLHAEGCDVAASKLVTDVLREVESNKRSLDSLCLVLGEKPDPYYKSLRNATILMLESDEEKGSAPCTPNP